VAQVGGEAGPVKRRGGFARGKETLLRSKVALKVEMTLIGGMIT
jgi:hypothetical protein